MILPDAPANDGALTVEQIAALRQQDIDLEAYPLLRDAQAPIREQYGVAIDVLLAANTRLQAQVERAVEGLEDAMFFGTPDGDGDGEPGFANADNAATAARDALADIARLKGGGE